MGKGGKRTKGTKVALGDFIGESSGNTINVGGKAVDLPSAPRASTLEIDISKLPSRPPYTATVANLAYDVTEEDLAKFFDDIEISDICIPRDDDMGDKRFKGVAYVSVDGPNAVDSLAHLLAKSDHLLLNRKCKIDIYQERGSRFGDRPGRRGFDSGRDDPDSGRSDANDWRRGGNDDRSSFDRRDDRRGYDDRRGGGGFDRYNDRRGGDRYDDRRGGGGYDDRRGGYDDRDRRGGYDDRRGGGYDDRRGGGYDDRRGGDRYDDRRRDGGFGRSAADDDNSWRRSAPEIPERRDIPPERERNERPRLQLQKRSDRPEDAGEKSATSASIFGAAKPIDVSKRESEIEEKLQKQSVPREPGPKSASSASIFGAAKPIDTSKREKEIEEKLSKMQVSDNRPPPRRQEVEKLNPEERAAMAEQELKKRVEMGIDDSRPECDRENVVVTSRFSALEDDE